MKEQLADLEREFDRQKTHQLTRYRKETAMVKIRRTSPWSGITHEREIDVDPLEFDNWKYYWDFGEPSMKPLQEAFPYLSPGDREFLDTGITPEEWALDEINARRVEAGRVPVDSIDEFGDEVLEFEYGIVQRSKVVLP